MSVKKYYRLFGALCCLIYFTSYITRINFGAVVAEIVEAEGIAKSALSIVVMMGFISYGSGQILSGMLGDVISPKNLIFAGLMVTSVCNFTMPFGRTIPLMAVVWFINGLAQAFMWPPLMKLLTRHLDGKVFGQVVTNVSAAASVGTIFVYLAAPVLIRVQSWRSVFYFAGSVGILVAIIWMISLPGIIRKLPVVVLQDHSAAECEAQQKGSTLPTSIRTIFKQYGLAMICLAIAAQGILRDGITTWIPSFIAEVFEMEAASSILASVVLPIMSIISLKLFDYIYQKLTRNEVKFSAGLFGVAAALIVLWSVFYEKSVLLSVLLAAVVVGMAHGINLMLICVVPKRFVGCGKESLLSGILNAFTYVGSALSAYGLVKVSEIAGWQATIWTWAVVAVVGMVLCGLCMKRFKDRV